MDFSLLRKIHPFGWYLHYILVWYILIYVVWKVDKTGKQKIILLIALFSVWFFIKSIVFIYAVLHLSRLNKLLIILYNFFAVKTCTIGVLGIIELAYSLKFLKNKGVVIVPSFSL